MAGDERDPSKLPTTAITTPNGNPARPKIAWDERFVGQTLAGRYRIGRKLGQGGMGVVFLAEHVFIEKQVAIKILNTRRDHELLERFAREAKAASKIGHENIVDVTDFGETDAGETFIAMEYLEGRDVGRIVRNDGPLPVARAVRVLYQVCRALAAAHDKGIVHRDLKPDNILLVERRGHPDFVKILDFGLARATTLEGAPRLTKSGTILGTPEYMAPEQVRGDPVDGRADIYAAGCTLYEMLTGDVPFKGSFASVLSSHLSTEPEPPSRRAPSAKISEALDAAVLKALAKGADERFQTMKDFALAICAAVGDDPQQVWRGGGDAGPPTVHALAASPARARGRWVAALVAASLAVTGGALWLRSSRRSQAAAAQTRVVLPHAAVAAQPTAARQPPTQSPPAAAAAPRTTIAPTTHLTITSIPADAEVHRGTERLGHTPLEIDLPTDPIAIPITVTKHGFKDATVELVPDHDREYSVRLRAAPRTVSTPPAAPARPAPAKPAGNAELKDVFDE